MKIIEVSRGTLQGPLKEKTSDIEVLASVKCQATHVSLQTLSLPSADQSKKINWLMKGLSSSNLSEGIVGSLMSNAMGKQIMG